MALGSFDQAVEVGAGTGTGLGLGEQPVFAVMRSFA